MRFNRLDVASMKLSGMSSPVCALIPTLDDQQLWELTYEQRCFQILTQRFQNVFGLHHMVVPALSAPSNAQFCASQDLFWFTEVSVADFYLRFSRSSWPVSSVVKLRNACEGQEINFYGTEVLSVIL
eukprot:IDg1611t1